MEAVTAEGVIEYVETGVVKETGFPKTLVMF
ncbi:hypothetical protein BASH2_04232 [Bacillus anthracis]|nr:hypothetical protein BASH2_04232 [Bacillus anthracis]